MNTNTINQMDLAIKPREKLEEKGVKALSDKELVMILIGKGSNGHTIEEVAEKVLKVLDKGSEPLLTDLKYIPGMGQAKATAVLAALELGRRRPNRKTKVIRRVMMDI